MRTAVREDSSAFCFPSYGHGKPKNPTASRVPAVGNVKHSCASLPLRLQLAARLLTAALSGGAAGLHATREVVSGKHDFEVVGDEGAQIAVRIADLVLRLVGLHHGDVSLRALRRRCRRAVLLPPRRGKLRFLLKGGLNRLLLFTVRLCASMIACLIHLTCAFVDTNISSVLLAQFATD